MNEDCCGFDITMISLIAFEKNKTFNNTFYNPSYLLLLNWSSFFTIGFNQLIDMKNCGLKLQFEYFSLWIATIQFIKALLDIEIEMFFYWLVGIILYGDEIRVL